MATSTPVPGGDITLVAGEDLSSNKFRFVVLSGNKTVEAVDNVADVPCGIQQNDECDASGKAVAVRILGVSKVVAGAAFDAGAKLGPDSVGRAVAKTTDAAVVAALALEGANAAGNIVSCIVTLNAQRAS